MYDVQVLWSSASTLERFWRYSTHQRTHFSVIIIVNVCDKLFRASFEWWPFTSKLISERLCLLNDSDIDNDLNVMTNRPLLSILPCCKLDHLWLYSSRFSRSAKFHAIIHSPPAALLSRVPLSLAISCRILKYAAFNFFIPSRFSLFLTSKCVFPRR